MGVIIQDLKTSVVVMLIKKRVVSLILSDNQFDSNEFCSKGSIFRIQDCYYICFKILEYLDNLENVLIHSLIVLLESKHPLNIQSLFFSG